MVYDWLKAEYPEMRIEKRSRKTPKTPAMEDSQSNTVTHKIHLIKVDIDCEILILDPVFDGVWIRALNIRSEFLVT